MNSLFLHNDILLAFWSPGPGEMIVIAVVALLLYGGNLPEVARSWGKSFAEFRRGLTGFQSELNSVIYNEPEQIEYRDDSRYSEGYEVADDYQESDDYQDDPDERANESEESEKTVKEVGADTVVIESPDETSAD